MNLNSTPDHGEVTTEERRMIATEQRLSQAELTDFAAALEMEEDTIDPTDAVAAIFAAAKRGRGDLDKALEILLEAGIVVEIRSTS
jgi:hypothetical protein